jgi:hypothetical protein
MDTNIKDIAKPALKVKCHRQRFAVSLLTDEVVPIACLD